MSHYYDLTSRDALSQSGNEQYLKNIFAQRFKDQASRIGLIRLVYPELAGLRDETILDLLDNHVITTDISLLIERPEFFGKQAPSRSSVKDKVILA